MEVVGNQRFPNMLDKQSMKYTTAFIMETQRVGSIVPLGLTYECVQTQELNGYTIPADTIVFANIDAILKDENVWGEPLVFRPERFLDGDKVIVPDHFIPFFIGRCYCMGEALARMELFLFISSIFQRFLVLPEDPDNPPPPLPIFGVTSAPKPFRVRLVVRDDSRKPSLDEDQ